MKRKRRQFCPPRLEERRMLGQEDIGFAARFRPDQGACARHRHPLRAKRIESKGQNQGESDVKTLGQATWECRLKTKNPDYPQITFPQALEENQ